MPESYPTVKVLIPKPISGMVKIPKTLGEHLRNKRLQEGLLQKDIIKQLKTTVMTLSHWENNKTEAIPVNNIPAIISFLGYCPIESFKNDGEKLTLFRKHAGLTQKQLDKKLGSDEKVENTKFLTTKPNYCTKFLIQNLKILLLTINREYLKN